MELSACHCREPFRTFAATTGGASVEADRGIGLRDVLMSNYLQLHRRLHHYLGCADLASDCLHEAWLRLGETRLPTSVCYPEAYVYRAACNVAMDQLRAQRAMQSLDEAQWEQLRDESPDSATVAEACSGVAALERVLGCLPTRHRTVLVALRLEEKTREEVARGHGLSLRRVDTVLRQALDCCAEACGQAVYVGVRSQRRALPRRWRENVERKLAALPRRWDERL